MWDVNAFILVAVWCYQGVGCSLTMWDVNLKAIISYIIIISCSLTMWDVNSIAYELDAVMLEVVL